MYEFLSVGIRRLGAVLSLAPALLVWSLSVAIVDIDGSDRVASWSRLFSCPMMSDSSQLSRGQRWELSFVAERIRSRRRRVVYKL